MAKRLEIGINDLASQYPQIASEWDCVKNGLSPEQIVATSAKKAWWICEKGHGFQQAIDHRTLRNQGCPICSNRLIVPGINDLETTRPELAAEWDYEKNTEDIRTISDGFAKKVWWKCPLGHSYLMSPHQRVIGQNCPVCMKETQTSFPEQAVFYYISKLFPDSVNGFRKEGIELDIWIPSIRTAIEYDGVRWHNNATVFKRELKKNEWCSTQGIRLIRIREQGLLQIDNCENIIRDSNTFSELSDSIKRLMLLLNRSTDDIDVRRDSPAIYAQLYHRTRENSLAITYPLIAKEWDWEKNSLVTPDIVSGGSDLSVWWKCEKGHSWQAIISSRTGNRKNGCPYCSNKRIIKGFNDFQTVFPKLATEWDYEKNLPLKPDEVAGGTAKKVWWICPRGHSYQAKLNNRTSSTTSCPYCSNLYALKGFNDLVTIAPLVAADWNYSRNGNKRPEDYVFGSHEKVWWKCDKGHEWQAQIINRTSGDRTGCPYCSQKRVLVGYNDLKTLYPEIAREWDYSKNQDVSIEKVSCGSVKVVWWICPNGHEYDASVHNRVAGRGCPYCSGHRVLGGFNDLETLMPDVAAEWDYEKNVGITPRTVTCGSGKKVWWKCVKGHSWYARIDSRTGKNKNGCPMCRLNKPNT